MKKIGMIKDAILRKNAEAKGPEWIAMVNKFSKVKVAMLAIMLDAAEKETGVILKNEVRKNIVKTALQYIPIEFMSKKGEADKVFEYANGILTKIFMSGLKKKGEALFNIKATKAAQEKKKQASNSNIDVVGNKPVQGAKNQDGNIEQPAASVLVEEKMADEIYDNLGDNSAPSSSILECEIQSAGDKMDMMAAVNAPMSKPDPSNPNPGAVVASAVELNSVDKQASAFFDRLNGYLDTLGVDKKAEAGVAPAVPAEGAAITGTAAEVADAEATKDVDTNPELSKEVQIDVGKMMDELASETGLNEFEKLLDEAGADEKDQVNPISAVEPVKSKDSERQVNSSDDGSNVDKAPKKAAPGGIFSKYLEDILN